MESEGAWFDDLSAAQRHVFEALKRLGEASADELAEALSITPSAVRQHLGALKSHGIVAARQVRGKPGRPADLYHATALGEERFARASSGLSAELLSDIAEEDPELVSRALDRRRRRRVSQVQEQLSGMEFDEKVAALAEILDAEGYMADFAALADGRYRVTLHSCAIWDVASRYGRACDTELEFLQELLPEAEIARVAHKVAGAYVCGYELGPSPVTVDRSRVRRRFDVKSA